MRLAAIYLEDHEFLFDKPQTINFGGKYFYQFIREGRNIKIVREPNLSFVPGFFDLTDLNSKITHVNAVVGQNGAGKTSFLNIVRRPFIRNTWALPQVNKVLVGEDEEYKVIILYTNFESVRFEGEDNPESRAVFEDDFNPDYDDEVIEKEVQTIFYSPHFDFKYDPRFDNIDDHDISLERTISHDLEKLFDESQTSDVKGASPMQELLFKNSIRQLEFLSSSLVADKKIFAEIFELQDHYDPLLVIKSYKRVGLSNIPDKFEPVLEEILKKSDDERRKWPEQKVYIDGNYINELDVRKYILKRHIIVAFVSLLLTQMNKSNDYLKEGFFSDSFFDLKFRELDAYHSLILFMEAASLQIREGATIKLEETPILVMLLEQIYSAIDHVQIKSHLDNFQFRTTKEFAIKILSLQRVFLANLARYYHHFHADNNRTIPDSDKVEGAINYMPFTRRLSSGENALLNMFSNLYNFLNGNLKGIVKHRIIAKHYIILFDEADLGFHSNWKRKFVFSLLKTLPHFFNELDSKPSLQIIFTTHDPLTLSDLPNSNVIYLERPTYEYKTNVLDYNSVRRPNRTFGANISELLADSFFNEDLVGDFARQKINDVIAWLNDKSNKEGSDVIFKVISMIDEPIVQRKLIEMFDEKMSTNKQLEIIGEQIKKLEQLRNKLTS